MTLSTRRLAPVLAGLAMLAALLPATASAASYKKSLAGALASAVQSASTTCDDAPLTQPFAPWGDQALYKLAPGGDFELDAAEWALEGGAAVVPADDSLGEGAPAGAGVLELPPGASASSPGTCVTIAYPTLRFFAASPKTAWLNVDVVYDRYTFPSGAVKVGDWSPSRLLLTGSVSLEPQHMSVRITNMGNRTVRVDDVFVDPYRRS